MCAYECRYVCISYAQQPSVHPFVTNEKSALNFATGTKRVHTLRLYLSACALHTQTHTHTLGSRLNSAHTHTNVHTSCMYIHIHSKTPTTAQRSTPCTHVQSCHRFIVSLFRYFVVVSLFARFAAVRVSFASLSSLLLSLSSTSLS